jgi:hypothetical protein
LVQVCERTEWANQTAASGIYENSKPLISFCFLSRLVPVIVQKTNSYMQQVAQARNKPYIQDF